jgi:NitT/TauT family transport system substrate-binding protein
MIDRRTFVAGIPLALLLAPRLSSAADASVLFGPPAAPSIILAHAVASGALGTVLPGASFKTWKTPDEMRAGLSSGSMSAVIVPTYVAANLYNRGLGVRLANVLTDGLLYVVAPQGTVTGIAGLKGKRVAVPFRNDMPDYLLRRLLAASGSRVTDVAVEYSATPPEAVQLLMAGRVDAALLSEPAVTAAIARAGAEGRKLERAVDCRKAWLSITGRGATPQAGLAVTDKLVDRIGAQGLSEIQRALAAALRSVQDAPAAAAAGVAASLELPAPVIERSIPFSNLVVRTASSAREDLAALFDVLAKEDPRIIGGKQPDDRFYAL